MDHFQHSFSEISIYNNVLELLNNPVGSLSLPWKKVSLFPQCNDFCFVCSLIWEIKAQV